MAAARSSHQGADPRDSHVGAVSDHSPWRDPDVGAQTVSRQWRRGSDSCGELKGRSAETVAVGKQKYYLWVKHRAFLGLVLCIVLFLVPLITPNVWDFPHQKPMLWFSDTNWAFSSSVQFWHYLELAHIPPMQGLSPTGLFPDFRCQSQQVPCMICPSEKMAMIGQFSQFPLQIWWHTEFRKALYLLFPVYYKRYNSLTAKWKRCMGCFPSLSWYATLIVPQWIHQPGSSLNSSIKNFFWGSHCFHTIKSFYIGDWKSSVSLPSPEVGMLGHWSFNSLITWLVSLTIHLHPEAI